MNTSIHCMCGILGYTGESSEGQWGQTLEILKQLFIATEHRGKHATGFVARTEPFRNRLWYDIILEKQPVSASEFVEQNQVWKQLKHKRCSTVLGHCRWATHGDPCDNQNNHPFTGRLNLYLVHNGILINHRAICNQHHLTVKSECDSEAILRYVESFANPVDGLDLAINRFDGSMAVAIFDEESDLLYLARNDGKPFWLLKLKCDKRWFFASTRDILLTAMNRALRKDISDLIEILIPMASGHVHILSSQGYLLANGGHCER